MELKYKRTFYCLQGVNRTRIYNNENDNDFSDTKNLLDSDVNNNENHQMCKCSCLPNFIYNCCLIVSVTNFY